MKPVSEHLHYANQGHAKSELNYFLFKQGNKDISASPLHRSQL